VNIEIVKRFVVLPKRWIASSSPHASKAMQSKMMIPGWRSRIADADVSAGLCAPGGQSYDDAASIDDGLLTGIRKS
jgi:hypothetical protein